MDYIFVCKPAFGYDATVLDSGRHFNYAGTWKPLWSWGPLQVGVTTACNGPQNLKCQMIARVFTISEHTQARF